MKLLVAIVALLAGALPSFAASASSIACTGFSRTKVIDAVVPANGTMFVRYYTNTQGVFRDNATVGFGANEALVVAFKAPATVDPIFQIGVTHTGTGVIGAQTTRAYSLSTKPCDWTTAVWSSKQTVMALKLASGPPSAYSRIGLTPGQTYYVNVDNRTCPQARCDVYVSILNNKP
jgi:hypothetical protein